MTNNIEQTFVNLADRIEALENNLFGFDVETPDTVKDSAAVDVHGAPELKPCPFCGGGWEYDECRQRWNHKHKQGSNCPLSFVSTGQDEIALWNQRAPAKVVPDAETSDVVENSIDKPIPKYRVWECKIVVPWNAQLPNVFDTSPRIAARNAIEKNVPVLKCFSGWGGSLSKYELEEVENL